MYPPPSTDIGIINSLGLFLMGCDIPPDDTFDCDIVIVVSVSESLVDCRDKLPALLETIIFNFNKNLK